MFNISIKDSKCKCICSSSNDLFLIECGNKTYGAECKEPCGKCKNMRPCHHVNGNCPSGCESGVYGKKCKQPCGNCSNGHLCNEVDGSCQFGCDAGVYGKKCSIGSTIYLSKRYMQSYRWFSQSLLNNVM